MAKHKSPSKTKYDRENPPVTIRLTRDLRGVLDLIKGERTRSKAIQMILAGKLEPALEIKNRAIEIKNRLVNECAEKQRVIDKLDRELRECRDQTEGE